MDTRDIAAEYRLAHWAQIMRNRIDSGLSIRAFCENAGIRENTYFYWQKKLRETACEELAMIQTQTVQTDLVGTGFTEVKLGSISQAQISHAEGELHGALQIEMSGVKITATSTYPADKLSYILLELVKQC